MTGPEHYREAEKLLTEAQGFPRGAYSEQSRLTAAQVHATLALAAATVELGMPPLGVGNARERAWRAAFEGTQTQ